jgi:hypothetical protein
MEKASKKMAKERWKLPGGFTLMLTQKDWTSQQITVFCLFSTFESFSCSPEQSSL